jgi:nicotinamide mononucleotide transporter
MQDALSRKYQILSPEVLVEVMAVALNLLYTFLYLNENSWCWPAAFSGSLLFVWLCWKKKLIAETALQVFYVGFAVYGFLTMGKEWGSNEWPLSTHAIAVVVGFVACIALAIALRKKTDAQRPYVDSFTTVFSLIATFFMVNYIHENWLYWIVVDAVAIYLYASRRMYFGSLLFVVYLLMAISGYFELNWFS